MSPECIINFSRGSWYPRGQERLLKAAEQYFSGDVFHYSDESQLDCPRHDVIPYAFKCYAIERARAQGYERIFYFDASVYPVKPMAPLIQHVATEGYFFQRNGHMSGPWCKDSALEPLGVTREELFLIPQFSAGCIGLDFRYPRTREFFDKWFAFAREGSTFTGPWRNDNQEISKDPRVRGHRHDQTVASVIAYRLDMAPLPDRTYMAYVGDGRPEPPVSVVLHLCGA